MAANYLHGVETIEVERGPRPVNTVKSAVIALIGTAPAGPVGMTLVLGERDSGQFGRQLPGFTIPQALDAINDHGGATVLVVNVLDPAVHKTAVTAETVSFTGGKAQLTQVPVLNLVLKSSDGMTTYVEGTDYTLDAVSGQLTAVGGGAIAAEATADYDYPDPAKVTPADIIGALDEAGNRTGMKALHDSYNLYGFFAKILIAPGYCTQNSVSTELIVLAEQFGGVAYIDAPIGTTFAQALAGRGPEGTINFNTSSDRVRLCYPHVKVYDPETDSERLEPLSSRAAGLRAKVDLERGFWWSSSNQEILGITGVERKLSARIDDPQSEVNLLNEVGITTIFNSFGSGLRLWGNRTAAFPTVTHMRNFENVRRTADVINESLRYFSLQYIDMSLTDALIDSLVESVNGYGRKLIGDGALLGFQCWFDPARNPDTERAAGRLLLSYKFTPPPPLERLGYESEITSEYLLTLKAA